MTCGIYKITNKANGHSYVGLSKNIERRFADHKSKALHPQKKDDMDKALYKAIRKYGVDNFTFEIIETCEPKELCDKERFWIAYYNTFEDKHHYNETPGGDVPGPNAMLKGESHGMALLNNKDVEFCRKCYAEGRSSRDVWNQYYSTIIPYNSFQKMWHGYTWKHIMPEVFLHNLRPKLKYGAKERDDILQDFYQSKMSMRQYCKVSRFKVGYGTLWKMINDPEFYNSK